MSCQERSRIRDQKHRGALPTARVQLRRSDRVIPIPEMGEYDISRFWSRITRREEDECWPWQGGTSGKGYGRFRIDGKLYSPHRIAYELTHGKLDNLRQYHGTVVRHTCDNPGCCNPKHLISGSQWQNVRDMDARGRRGPVKWTTVPEDVIIAVREATGTNRAIAKQFRLNETYVGDLRRGRYRSNVR